VRDRRRQGLRKAVDKAFGNKAAVQRCQWHKRENVVRYLAASEQATFRRKLQAAYEQPRTRRQDGVVTVRSELTRLNASR